MALTGALCRRFGSARVVVAGAVWLSLALLLPALARSATALGLGLAVFGIGYGGLNVAMNSLAVDLVAVLRRPVMPSFHAAWSLGGLAGAALGGLAAPTLTPLADFSLVCLLGLAVTAAYGRVVLANPLPAAYAGPGGKAAEPPGPGGSGGAAGTGQARAEKEIPNAGGSHPAAPAGHSVAWRTVLLLGVIALCSTYGEGAVSDWGALHLREDLGAASGLAAAGYAAFALARGLRPPDQRRTTPPRADPRPGLRRPGHLRGNVRHGAVPGAPARPDRLRPTARPRRGQRLPSFGHGPRRRALRQDPHGVATAPPRSATWLPPQPAHDRLPGSAVSLGAALTTVSLLAVVAVALARAASPAGKTHEMS